MARRMKVVNKARLVYLGLSSRERYTACISLSTGTGSTLEHMRQYLKAIARKAAHVHAVHDIAVDTLLGG
jgi:hypothetical protein